MPWYRTDDGKGVYHACIRGRNGSPAACRAPCLEGDNPAHGEQCGRMGGKLCDARVGQSGSCDMPICDKHATPAGDNIDYCPRHAHLAAPLADPRRV